MKTRLNIYLSPDLHDELAKVSHKRNVSKSSVIEAAVASLFSPDSADVRDAAFIRRLDRITRALERIERDQVIAVETVALFIRFWLAITPPLGLAEQDSAKAKGVERYRDFVETLGRRLQRGHSLVREVSFEIWPEQRGSGVARPLPPEAADQTGDSADAG